MNIAVLEDNPAIVEYMMIALQMAGHHVDIYTQATSLFEALFTEEGVRNPLPFDALTVDLLLPGGISGFEVLTRIRNVLPSHSLPLIVLTGANLRAIEQVSNTFPEVAILQKPFKMEVLLELLIRTRDLGKTVR